MPGPRLRPRQAPGRPPPVACWGACACALAALLACGDVRAAAFLPGAAPPDPPTGDTVAAASPEEPLARGNGIRWVFVPYRLGGSVGLDWRRLNLHDGRTSTQNLLLGDVLLDSYVWQPWFIRVGSALGVLLGRDSGSGGDAPPSRSSTLALTGNVHVSVFPVSRFPFDLKLSVSDSRASGESLVSDYRTVRLGLNQSYQPMQGNSRYALNLDYSRVTGSDDLGDSLLALFATSLHQWEEHVVDSALNFSTYARSGNDDRSRFASATLRHGFRPDSAFSAENFASWTDNRSDFGVAPARFSTGSGSVQLLSVMNWRARPGDWLYSELRPVTLGGSVRIAETSSTSGGLTGRDRVFSLGVGASKVLSASLRATGSFNYGHQQSSAGPGRDQSNAAATLGYTPAGAQFGDWRYAPTASGTLSVVTGTGAGARRTAGLQASHSVARTWPFAAGQSLSLNLAQSAGVLVEAPANETSRGLSHALGLSWQSAGDNGAQTLASVSFSDSRSTSQGLLGTYQFANLQLSRRARLSRYNSWSANLTAQASRSDTEQIDPFTGDKRAQDDGWQYFYTGSVSFDSARAFGVPRLRFSALLTVNSQQFEQRRLGDVNAPVEQTTESAEARLDYTIGRLESRLSARYARVDGRKVASLSARIQRRF